MGGDQVNDTPSIYEAMAAVLADLPAIGKNQRNVQQGFQFRGIDDVLDALNPVLSKHGVFYVPDVVERLSEERPTKSGGVLYTVHLHVRYRFYGPAGDYVEASGWGEGTDSGDKATNKAMTGAMKYVLFQTFAIATAEQSENDADRHQAEPTQAERPWRVEVRKAVGTLSDEDKADLKAWVAEQGLPSANQLNQSQAASVLAQIATYGKEEPETTKPLADDESIGNGEGGQYSPPNPEDLDSARREAGKRHVQEARAAL